MTRSAPLVSIIMTVYDGERFLRSAIDSLFAQSLTDFELIVINDGSTDGTAKILDSYHDPRLVRIDNPENMGKTHGLSFSPNTGLAVARGKYIARQDADDVSKANRLAIEVDHLEKNPPVGLVGSWVEIIDTKDRVIGNSKPSVAPALLKWQLAFQNCFTQSSVMFRREVIERLGPYDEAMKHGEDYELWWRISTDYPVVNLPQMLVQRRITPGGIVDTFPDMQREYAARVVQRAVSHRIGTAISIESARELDCLIRGKDPPNADAAKQTAHLILASYKSFLQSSQVTSTDRALIGKDAAEKLYVLAGKCRAIDLQLAMKIALRAERLAPRLPTPRTICKILLKT